MTRLFTRKRFSSLLLFATAAVLPFATAMDAGAQGFRIGIGGGGFIGGQPNFGRSPSSVGRQIQGVARTLANPNSNYPNTRRRPTYVTPPTRVISPSLPPVRAVVAPAPECETLPLPAPIQPDKTIHPVSEPGVPPQPDSEPTAEEQAREHVLAAREAFEKQDYRGALQRMDVVVNLVPKNQDARQFRSLILFALAEYKSAAAEAYDAILLGPVWTWDTLRTLYSDTKVYREQYRGLQQVASAQPDSLDVHFLLAYQHLMLGHLKHGEAELLKVLKIQPDEPVTQQLLQAVRAAQGSLDVQTARK
jgi:tetratricopeptide (TPR) repeat protein